MPIIQILVILIVIGVILWLVNTYGGPYIDAKILKIINVAIVILVILWLLGMFFPGLWSGSIEGPTVRHVR